MASEEENRKKWLLNQAQGAMGGYLTFCPEHPDVVHLTDKGIKKAKEILSKMSSFEEYIVFQHILAIIWGEIKHK